MQPNCIIINLKELENHRRCFEYPYVFYETVDASYCMLEHRWQTGALAHIE